MKGASSSDTPKSFVQATRNSAENAQSLYRKEEHIIVKRSFASTVKDPTRGETKNI